MTATEESLSFWGLEISFKHETLPLHFVCGKNLILFIVNFVLVLLKIKSYFNFINPIIFSTFRNL